jgi:hypothetical protein
VTGDVTHDLSAAGGMTDVDHVGQAERLDERGEIVSVRVHVVPGPRLGRSAMTAAIMRDSAKSIRGEEEHLLIPRVSVERPPVTEDNGLTRAPILVKDFRVVSRCYARHPSSRFGDG